MAPTTPTGEPTEIVAGDSVRWRIPDHTDYPQSEGWTLEYNLLGISKLATEIQAVWQTSGDDLNHWLVSLATSDTSGLLAGRYQLLKRFVGSGTYDGREETIARLLVSVVADPRTADAGDFQTSAEKELALVRGVIQARLTNDVAEEYTLAGRRFRKMSLQDLRKDEARLVARVRTERTRRVGRPVLVEFNRAGL